LILGLHKRLFHMTAIDLRRNLHKAGVPLSVLVFVDDAVATCATCRAFAAPSARPNVKIKTATRFNHTVYCDLIFFDSCILFAAVDEAIRWLRITVSDFKNEESPEKAFRRSWLALYGAPCVFRSDKESVFNCDRFAVYLAKNNTK